MEESGILISTGSSNNVCFVATVESVLLYGCEAWTVTSKLEKELDGCYTRLLRTAFNVHWSQHMTNKELYGKLPKVSEKIRERRLRFAGHSCRKINEPISQLLLWKPKHGKRKPGRPHLTYTDLLKKDTGLELTEIKAAMLDRNAWKASLACFVFCLFDYSDYYITSEYINGNAPTRRQFPGQ